MIVTGRNVARGEKVAADVGATFVPADLTAEADCVRLVSEAVRLVGLPTILVNNAVGSGGTVDGPVADVTSDVWRKTLEINLIAPATMCRLVVPLLAGHGSIVNISSRAATRGTPGQSAYGASKAALGSLARTMTMDYAGRGIRCNVVQPGYIIHQVRDAEATAAHLQRYQATHLTRLPAAQDVAAAVLFLASHEAKVVTGVTLPVDGGSSLVRGSTLG